MRAIEQGLASCHSCGRVGEVVVHKCGRCGASLHQRKEASLQRCVAFGIAGILAYIPANLMPIMEVNQLGVKEANTILGGVFVFWEMHAYPVAITIFIASVLIPGLKFVSLALLCAAAAGKLPLQGKTANALYFITELVGRWSMVDVFVVVILAGLIQMGNLMTITPGAASLAFGLMVILTMLAAHAFDPRLIWDRLLEKEDKR